MVILPTIINAIYFWVCDSFLKNSEEKEEEVKDAGSVLAEGEDTLNE
jgi:hypothetical protein